MLTLYPSITIPIRQISSQICTDNLIRITLITIWPSTDHVSFSLLRPMQSLGSCIGIGLGFPQYAMIWRCCPDIKPPMLLSWTWFPTTSRVFDCLNDGSCRGRCCCRSSVKCRIEGDSRQDHCACYPGGHFRWLVSLIAGYGSRLGLLTTRLSNP